MTTFGSKMFGDLIFPVVCAGFGLLYSLHASAQLDPEAALKGLVVADGLEISLFAAEPVWSKYSAYMKTPRFVVNEIANGANFGSMFGMMPGQPSHIVEH